MLGYVIAGMVRGLLVATITVGTALSFVQVPLHAIVVGIGALLLTTLISALAGFITAVLAKDFDQMAVIQTLILTPLTYLGGVFNPVSSLPDWAQRLSLANPMFYMVNAFRYGFLGIADVSVGVSMLVLSAFAVV
jgi:ABC-2 type transport system permease protein